MSLKRLHHKLVFYVLSCVIFLAAIAVTLSFITEFNRSKIQTEVMLTQLMDTVESTAAIAAYTHNNIIAEDVINGLLRNDVVYKASIVTDQGLLAKKQKTLQIQKSPAQLIRPLSSPFSSQQTIGQLIISPNIQFHFTEALHAAYSNAINSMFLIVSTTLILLFVVRSKISKPLVEVSDTLHAIKAGEKNRLTVLESHKYDEFGRLVNDINGLLKNLEIKLAQEQILRKSVQHMEKQLRHIYESSSAGLFLLDINGNLISHNPTLLQVIQPLLDRKQSNQTIIGENFASMFIEEKDEFQLMLGNALRLEQLQTQDFSLQLERGATTWVHCLLSKAIDSLGETRIEGVVFDVSKRVINEQATKHKAEHDSLTGLFLRQAIRERFDSHALKENTPEMSILLLDLDGFKQVNDTYGHDAGDQVLITVAKRLKSCVRTSDLVARIGGDEFLIIIFNNQVSNIEFTIAYNMVQSIQHPIVINQGISINIGASIGIATTLLHGQNFDTLVKSADESMYEIKRQGKNGYAIKDDAKQTKVTLF